MSQDTSNHSFDDLARGLASGSITRGRAIRLMGAALVGGTLASVGMGEAGADQCKPTGKKCKKDKQCCSGNCAGGTCGCTPGTPCGTGGYCFANASGTGSTCDECGADCVNSCDECRAEQVCIALANEECGPFLSLACTTPAPCPGT